MIEVFGRMSPRHAVPTPPDKNANPISADLFGLETKVFAALWLALLERMKQDASRFIEAGEQPRLGLWEEVIPYHADYRPQETSDFVSLRIDTGRFALSNV